VVLHLSELAQLADAQHQLEGGIYLSAMSSATLQRETYVFRFQVPNAPALTEERIRSCTVPILPNVIDPRDVRV